MEEEHPGVRVTQARTRQLGPESRAEVLRVLGDFKSNGFFPLNPEVVPL